MPLTQESSTFLIVAARTAVDPMSIVPTLEAAARDINKDMPLFQTATMDQVLETSIAQQRLSLIVMVTFAVVALTLASLGLYGVIAHAVTERTHEIGVRMALGAEARHVLGLMIRQGLTTTAIGAAIGVAGAVALSRWIQDLLFGVTADRSGDVRGRGGDADGGRARRLLRAGVARDSRRSDYGTAIRIVAFRISDPGLRPSASSGRPEPVEGRIGSAAPWFGALISSSR